MTQPSTVLDRFDLHLRGVVRPATRDDLPGLEWYGFFTHHRSIIEEAYARQERGENLMLLAVANGFPVGQAWVDLAVRADEGVGVLWAVRVYPFLQGMGVGSCLMTAAETALRSRGFAWAEIGVEKDNPGARRLYERHGYQLHRELVEEFTYRRPDGSEGRETADQWMLRKPLRAHPGLAAWNHGPGPARPRPEEETEP